MTIITPDILRELRWLAASRYAITVIDKAILAELVTVWEAAKIAHSPNRIDASDGAKQLRLIFDPAAPELPLYHEHDQLDHWLNHAP